MRKRNKPTCITDKFMKEGKSVKIATTKELVEINNNNNVIYVISCKQCSFQYFGKSVKEKQQGWDKTEAMSPTRILMRSQ